MEKGWCFSSRERRWLSRRSLLLSVVIGLDGALIEPY
jgi:hypothetical protein